MRIYVYVDGFNLYYGCLKNSPYKWLDIKKLSELLFPRHEISKVKYYTARIKIRENDTDPDKPNRQQIYLRALRTLPGLEIIEGSFLSHTINMKLAGSKGYAKVIKTEEKGTDVNIASHIINDGHKGEYDMAVIISNDSDLVEPVRIVAEELKLPVIVISPFETNTVELKKVATGVKQIRKGVLAASQFPVTLTDDVGEFTKPEGWEE
jgi:uncharacterized LabA/DUF88 family protein